MFGEWLRNDWNHWTSSARKAPALVSPSRSKMTAQCETRMVCSKNFGFTWQKPYFVAAVCQRFFLRSKSSKMGCVISANGLFFWQDGIHVSLLTLGGCRRRAGLNCGFVRLPREEGLRRLLRFLGSVLCLVGDERRLLATGKFEAPRLFGDAGIVFWLFVFAAERRRIGRGGGGVAARRLRGLH